MRNAFIPWYNKPMAEQSAVPPGAEQSKAQTAKPSSSIRAVFLLVAVGLFAIVIFGMKWIFSQQGIQDALVPDDSAGGSGLSPLFLLFDYGVGLTMIFLPCTLPLAFVIVPLAMGKGYAKGLGIALSFGIGIAITLSFYGALLGAFGQALGLGRVELAKNILYTVAGFIAIFFALGEIGLTKTRMPSYSGKIPDFIQKQQDFLKAGLLGLFLGNVGVGCPNPLFNAVIIPNILATGDIFQGWLIMFVQALGRFTPLLLLAMLAILGVNATAFLVPGRTAVERATGWATVFVGGFMLTLGLFTHDWYVYSGIHTFLEQLTQEEAITNLLGQQVGALGHAHEFPAGVGLFGQPISWGSWFMVAIWIIPMVWYWRAKNKEAGVAPEGERPVKKAVLHWIGALVITLSVSLALIFGYFLPNRFVMMSMMPHDDEMMEEAEEDMSGPAWIGYTASLSEGPTPNYVIEPQTETFIAVRFFDKNEEPLRGIEIEHERIMHVLIAKEDFSVFAHIHPEDFGPILQQNIDDATFVVKYAFPSEGIYRIAAQVTADGNTVTKQFDRLVGEYPGPPSIQKDFTNEKTFDGYGVTITPRPTKVVAGSEATITYRVERGGQPVSDLTPYLGAAAHFAIWNADLSVESFAHQHGTVPDHDVSINMIPSAYAHGEEEKMEPAAGHDVPHELPEEFGPDIVLTHTFPYPGLWAIFGQFEHEGKVITTKFMIKVFPGSGMGSAAAQGHGH